MAVTPSMKKNDAPMCRMDVPMMALRIPARMRPMLIDVRYSAIIALAAAPPPRHRHKKSSVNMSAVYRRSCLHYSIFPDQSGDFDLCMAAGVRLRRSVSHCCTIGCAEGW